MAKVPAHLDLCCHISSYNLAGYLSWAAGNDMDATLVSREQHQSGIHAGELAREAEAGGTAGAGRTDGTEPRSRVTRMARTVHLICDPIRGGRLMAMEDGFVAVGVGSWLM